MVSFFEDVEWSSRKTFVMVLLCQFLGTMNFNSIPAIALLNGTIGYIIVLAIFQIGLGIPLVYLEFIVGQFTERDCIDVWKIRPCFSHIGYFLIFWQIAVLSCNHIVTSFIVHYFLITFESPIPYFTCGSWSTDDCTIFTTNYTVNKNCIQTQKLNPNCEGIYETFPEYQYWNYSLLSRKSGAAFYIAWKVSLASGLVGLIVYLMCFKKQKSLKCGVSLLAIFCLSSVLVIMMGSLQQKGVVVKSAEALGFDFKDFLNKFRLSNLIQQVVYNFGIGSGVTVNLASSSSFRSPCFSNTVIGIVIVAVFTTFTILTVAIISCPYAYEYGIDPRDLFQMPMTLTFEKLPRLVFEFEQNTFYLIIIFSFNAALGLCTNVTIFYNIMDITLRRNPKLSNYPGMTALCGTIILFLITTPLLGSVGFNLARNFRQYVILITTFIAFLECFLFVIWYGIHRVSEDVHFMLGIQPNNWMKLAWILSWILLGYAFVTELVHQIRHVRTYSISCYTLIAFTSFFVLLFIIKIIVPICKGRFSEEFTLDPTWGPKQEVLKRSRAMFTAHAMTKEYMYRQYHLQAGIISRQRTSNIRVNCE